VRRARSSYTHFPCFVISPADARCCNKSCTDNSSRWLVLPEYPILSKLQFCRPLGWRLPHSWRRNNFLVRPIQHDHGARTPHRLISFFLGFRRPNRITVSHLGPKNLSYLCITNLLCLRHRLIFHHWWHLSPQSLCHQQGLLLWCLLLCVIMWFQRIQRKWYFLHKTCAYLPRLLRCGRWSSWGTRVFTWGLTASPEVGRWQEGLWHGLFFLVFIFFLTSSLRRGALS